MKTRIVPALVTLLAGLALLSAGTASATVPGTNGKIAHVRDGDVWTMNADGANQQNLTSSPAAETDPAFSPDATKLAFARAGDIWVMRADGTDQTNLTNNPAPDRDPAWSPDGTKIVFMSDRERFVDRTRPRRPLSRPLRDGRGRNEHHRASGDSHVRGERPALDRPGLVAERLEDRLHRQRHRQPSDRHRERR